MARKVKSKKGTSIGQTIGRRIDEAQGRIDSLVKRVDDEREKQLNGLNKQIEKASNTIKTQLNKSKQLGSKLKELQTTAIKNRDKSNLVIKQRIEKTQQAFEKANAIVLDSRTSLTIIQAEIKLLQLAKEQTQNFQSILEQFESQLQTAVLNKESKLITTAKNNFTQAQKALTSLPAPSKKKTAKKTSKKKAVKKRVLKK